MAVFRIKLCELCAYCGLKKDGRPKSEEISQSWQFSEKLCDLCAYCGLKKVGRPKSEENSQSWQFSENIYVNYVPIVVKKKLVFESLGYGFAAKSIIFIAKKRILVYGKEKKGESNSDAHSRKLYQAKGAHTPSF